VKILVVDDEPNVVGTLSDFLNDCGHTTEVASDGLHALETMSRHGDIGLVIADVRMPRMDGIEFLTTIKVKYPGVPAILITGHGDEGLAVAALQEGATDYIKKPIKLRELRDSVAKVEERHALEATILSGLERDPTADALAATSRTVEELREINQEIEGLSQVWEAVRPHLDIKSAAEEDQRIVDFAVDEIPATLARLRARIDSLIKKEASEKGGLTSLF
jgi:DNA-binding NtrC family response regulator